MENFTFSYRKFKRLKLPRRGFSNLLLFSLLLTILSSCSTYGHYTNNPKDKDLDYGYDFILSKNDSFVITTYRNYSPGVVRCGNGPKPYSREFGTFIRKKDSIELTFCKYDSIVINIELITEDDSLELQVSVKDKIGETYFPSINCYNFSKSILISSTPNFDRNPKLKVKNDTTSNHILIKNHAVGSHFEQQTIRFTELKEGNNRFAKSKQKPKTNHRIYPRERYHGEKITFWFKPDIIGVRMSSRKNWYPRKWKGFFKFLNIFYLDY